MSATPLDPSACPRCGTDACEGCSRIAYSLADLRTANLPQRKPILTRDGLPIFRSGNLAQIHSERGIGKTWAGHTIALIASCGGEALGLRAPEPVNALVIDGEMSGQELQERDLKLADALKIPHDHERFRVIASDWLDDPLPRLDTPQGQALVAPHVDWADLIVLDNRSCLFDPDSETDPAAWAQAQGWTLSLRRRGKCVIQIHHSNRQGGARGHSKAEDVLDVIISMKRPEGYDPSEGARAIFRFEKARGIDPSATADFVATLTSTGLWAVDSARNVEEIGVENKLLAYLRTLKALGDLPKSATAAVHGAEVRKQAGLDAMRRLMESGRVHKVNGRLEVV